MALEQHRKTPVLLAVILALGFLLFAGWIVGQRAGDIGLPEERVAIEESSGESGLPVLARAMPEFQGIETWLNSEPLMQEDLRGKVVLIDFWTYSCINCIRTLPYVTSWYDKYEDDGFVVVGVHTPEFAFEKKRSNVEDAVARHGIGYPVALDNDYATWDNYDNRYWPAHYLFDARGRLRFVHFGEGKYDETEANIVALLEEAGKEVAVSDTAESDTEAAQPDFRRIGTHETYLGWGRMEYLGSPERVLRDQVQNYTITGDPAANRFYYGGAWRVERERGVLAEAPGAIVYRYNAANVNLVMGPPEGGPGRVEVLIDGAFQKIVTVDEERLYELHTTPDVYGEYLLELRFLDPGISVYAFTFG